MRTIWVAAIVVGCFCFGAAGARAQQQQGSGTSSASPSATPSGKTDGQGAAPKAGDAQAAGFNDAQAKPVDPEFRARVLKLMEITEMKETMAKLWTSMAPTVRPVLMQALPATQNRDAIVDTYLEELGASMQSAEAMEGYVQIYARHLTLADVNAAIQFYSTPEGDHVRRASQDMAPESIQYGRDLALKNAPLIMKSLCGKYPELQEDERVCGKADDKSKSELIGKEVPAGK
ncbi:MAG: DUF2059 domain-containing protein [Candidatus Acidiferrales bacterium]